jgi:uncharacterized protein YjbI with pentapeptide repeats
VDATFGSRARVAVVLGLVAVVVGCLFWLPRFLLPPLSEATLQARGVTNAKDRVELEHDRLRLENEARATLFQGFGGAAILLGAFFTWRQLQENVRNNRKIDAREREAQITERFTRAVDQFGREELDVRLGGLYSLERIAYDSEADRDRRAIVEVLAAFVRRRAAELAAAEQSPDDPEDPAELQVRAPDLQAVLTVLGRLKMADLDLEGTYLYKANLLGANLERSNLNRADLRKAKLAGAYLPGASLAYANLSDAYLDGATFEDANLHGASLERTSLNKAALGRAHLSSAKASGAWLVEADLRGAQLTNTHLNGARLMKANIRDTELLETDLRYAQLDGADLALARLNGVQLQGASLKEAKLAFAKILASDLSGAKLKRAILREADLTGTKLVGAYIIDAHLEKAVLFGADLSKVELSPARQWEGSVHLEGAVANKATIWPDGWNQQRAEAAGVRFVDEPATGS